MGRAEHVRAVGGVGGEGASCVSMGEGGVEATWQCGGAGGEGYRAIVWVGGGGAGSGRVIGGDGELYSGCGRVEFASVTACLVAVESFL